MRQHLAPTFGSRGRRHDWLLTAATALVLLAAGLFPFRGALELFFAQDDFRDLAVAAGIQARHADLWRHVSVQSFMDFFFPMFGSNPRPYHAVSLALHGANIMMLYALLSRRMSRFAAMAGAGFFAAHPSHFAALYWLSARADLMAAFFALLATALALRAGLARWLAIPAFILSLLSKESTLLLPLAILSIRAWTMGDARGGPGSIRFRALFDMPVLVMFAISGAYLAYLVVPRASGIHVETSHTAAYGLDFGATPARNLLTYVGWTVDLAMAKRGLRFVDAQNPGLFGLAAITLAAAFAACFVPSLRKRGWLAGLAAFLLLLLPVLPLRNHTYHYYLYAPLLAAALCAASLADRVLNRDARAKDRSANGRTAAAWGAALLIVVTLAWNGSRLVGHMESRPSPVYSGMYGDPIVDRAHIAQKAIRALESAPLPDGAVLGFVMRERLALIARIARGSGEAPPPGELLYPELNMKAAILDGLGVRAMIPRVASVVFDPPSGDPGPLFRFAVFAPTGEVEVFTADQLDSLLMSDWVSRW